MSLLKGRFCYRGKSSDYLPNKIKKMEIKHQLQINASSKIIFDAITTQAGITGWWAGNSKVNTELEKDSVLIFVKENQTVEMVLRAKEKRANEKFSWLCV